MAGDSRVFALLEEILESNRTPEDVCRDCPELLSEVRRRWMAFRRIDAEYEALLPPSTTGSGSESIDRASALDELPQIPGYRVEAVLAHGGMGVVYKAWHFRLHRIVALKMLLAGEYADAAARERFQREAEAVAALHHSNIVQVYDVGDVDGRPYFTMEFVEGGELSQQVQGTPQPARKAAALVATVADAVQAAHQSGIVHRDLKPANILLTADGAPKITDFGLARRLEGQDELTRSGAPMGTPSYMAPEQARGDKDAIGPATDVYALGAILYELLTGRPPFRAETPVATMHQIVADDPVSPTRLNGRVPRDLETICLKCLHKEPQRRYLSAADLADDLRRFERGEPIKARPVGSIEHGVRWVRRRPALAGALASGVLFASALAITIAWWQMQRAALAATAAAYAEADLRESERLREAGEFQTSAAVLQRAKERLVGFVSPTMQDRLAAAVENLELVKHLDYIRLDRVLAKPPAETLSVIAQPTIDVVDGATSHRQYQEAFRNAKIGTPGDDPAAVAARVNRSPVRADLVAALDDWTVCAADQEQLAWVREVIRAADTYPWRDRVRDPNVWEDQEALRDLAAKARLAEQSPQLLVVLGARMRAQKIDAVPFLSRVAAAYPKDFWANIELGNAFLDQSKVGDAVESYRAASDLRPESLSIHYALGCMYLRLQRWDRCVAEFEHSLRLDPKNAWCHNRLGVALAWRGGRDEEAIAHYRESIRLDPTIGWTHHHLASILKKLDRYEEAAAEFNEAARLFPEKRAEWKREMRHTLIKLARSAEALADWKQDLAALPRSFDEWFGFAELYLFLKDEGEFRRARRDLLAQFGATDNPDVAERVGRACLLMQTSDDELKQAVALAERAVAVGREGHEFNYPYYRFAEGLARCRQGRFDDAITIMTGDAAPALGACPRLVLAMALHQKGRTDEARQTLAEAIRLNDWTAKSADHQDIWTAHILRREAEALILPNADRDRRPNDR
jgi:tetratricopeptide (TPR) repeat protein/predicted Ser/Thr protein kinase